MLAFRQSPFSRFIIDTNKSRALFAAMTDANTGTAIFELFPEITDTKSTNELLFSVLVLIGVPEKLPNIQNPGMVIKGNIQACHIVLRIPGKQVKEAVKIPGTIFFKAPAALAGHIQTTAHSRIPII